MTYQYKELAAGRWQELSLEEQLANTGAEVGRAINWRKKGQPDYGQRAFERSLELFDLTIADPKNLQRLKEVVRVREVWAAYFLGDNRYGSTDESWEKYFNAFGYAARVGKQA